MGKFQNNGITFITLRIACPVCLEQGKNTPRTGWMHASNNCGGEIYVGENASYYCNNCSHTQHVRSWKYACPSHSSVNDEFLGVGSSAAIAEVVSCAGSLVSEAGQQWLIKFMENLGEW